MTTDKVKENRVRKLARRRGYEIEKSRRRDPNAVDFGGYMLIDAARNFAILGGQPFAYSSNLDEIEAYFANERGSAVQWAVGKVQETSFNQDEMSMPGFVLAQKGRSPSLTIGFSDSAAAKKGRAALQKIIDDAIRIAAPKI